MRYGDVDIWDYLTNTPKYYLKQEPLLRRECKLRSLAQFANHPLMLAFTNRSDTTPLTTSQITLRRLRPRAVCQH